MSVRKLPDGQWLCDFRPSGYDGRRYRKKFATKHEATAYQNHILENLDDRPWLGEKRDSRKLSDLINLWFSGHGITLKDGEKRKAAMLFFAETIGDPAGLAFTAKDFTQYREKRLSGEISRTDRVQTVAPRTLNLELSYLRAMFNELERMGEWSAGNPVKGIREFRTEESEMSWLDHEQIMQLLNECEASSSKHLVLVVKVALATGARWSEAETLTGRQLSKYRITYTKTKGKRNRTIPISPDLYEQLPKNTGRLFVSCYSAFRSALKRTGIDLPDGQLTHVLRHTFASHFMMGGGNILVLQKVLGHTDIKMTMRYAHFAPSHLTDVLALNPLENVQKVSIDDTDK
ncbi:phage integrase [Serratia fonticola]|uniref:phage integrase n=1 Tax=Serratia fonticola TaxID=47917 RepID=UPI003BB78E3A